MNIYNCPKCNTDFEKDSKFCQNCGCSLEKEFIETPICPKCNKNFPVGTRFCDNDGAKLVSSEKLISRCVKCGREYNEGTRFCPQDGGKVVCGVSKNENVYRNVNLDTMPETYQWQSIVVFIFCIVPLGLILTLPEIFNASKVKRLYESGDIEEAKRLSRRIKNGLLWSIGCTVVFWIIVVISLTF